MEQNINKHVFREYKKRQALEQIKLQSYNERKSSVHDFHAVNIYQENVALNYYFGQVLLLVNMGRLSEHAK